MNIFYLARDPVECAQYHCDKHVVKMIVESTQLLSNALPIEIAPYKRTHYNHPCSRWVRQSYDHVRWLIELTQALLIEWQRRWNHIEVAAHSCYDKLMMITTYWDHYAHSLIPMSRLPKEQRIGIGFTEPPQCMPDVYKHPDTVTAYRQYYLGEKLSFATWRNGAPAWFNLQAIN